MKLVVALAMLPLSAAFLAAPMPRASLAVRYSEPAEAATEEAAAAEEGAEPEEAAPAPAPAAVTINGWTPDESKFAWGLPGNIDPAGDFDPFGYAEGASLATMKMYREAEVTHGRVAMVATLGFLVQEKVRTARARSSPQRLVASRISLSKSHQTLNVSSHPITTI